MILVLGKDNTNDIKFVCAFHVFNSLNLCTTVVPCLYFDILDEFKAIDWIKKAFIYVNKKCTKYVGV